MNVFGRVAVFVAAVAAVVENVDFVGVAVEVWPVLVADDYAAGDS